MRVATLPTKILGLLLRHSYVVAFAGLSGLMVTHFILGKFESAMICGLLATLCLMLLLGKWQHENPRSHG